MYEAYSRAQNAHCGFPLHLDITPCCRVNLLTGTIEMLYFCSYMPRSSSNASICDASIDKLSSNDPEVLIENRDGLLMSCAF